ncbi:MAG TPA: Ig-like domain-containing protein [Longimicrobium sp.]|nr:Ig-like domain-containing protein [Longimicrobium sp.]
MLRLKRAAAAAAVLAVAACSADSKSPLAPEGPRQTISDAAHAGVVPGFYFLPPMVPQPTYAGTFDAALQPRVEICELSGSVCGTTIATFTFGTGSSSVRVDAAAQNYIVNWKTSDYNLDVNKNYRISVYQGAFRLGFADVDVVGAAKDLKNVDTNQYIALLDDRTLPIKFRIETGIAAQVVVSPASDSVNVGETKQFTASCTDLHGNAVSCPTTTWSSSNPAVATVSATGLATGVDAGTVTITASIGYAQGTATLKVIQPNTPPVANADTFQAIGNVTIPVSAPGVLANDTDTETPSGLSVVAGPVTTANGGTATLAADGSFTYLSAAGFTGTDSFEYTVTDGSLTATATVTVSVPTRVWYVSNANAPAGDGRDASPFSTLAAAEGPSAAGETVFLLYGNGTPAGYDAGFTFKNGQTLTGQGVDSNVTAVVNGETVVLLAAGSTPTVTNAAAGATLRLAQNNTAQGFNVLSTAGAGVAGSGFGTFTAQDMDVAASGGPSLDLQGGTVAASFASLSSANSAGAGLDLSAVSGSLTAPGGVIANAAGAGVAVSGGAATISYGGSISGSGTRAASVTGRTGGALTLSGDIADTNGGILVQNNTGGSIAFNGGSKVLATGTSNGVTLASNTGASVSFGGGGLAITTTTGTGFSATGGGTVNVTGAGNTIAASGATALGVVNTTIGASGLSFRSISAANGGNGIVLDNTGAVNGLQVTGSGVAGSGGTIANVSGADGSTAGIGVYLNGARNVSLSWMQINDASNYAIRGVDVQNFTLASSVVSGTNGTSASLAEGSISFTGLTGSATVSGSNVSGGITNNVRVVNASGVLNRLTVSGTTVGGNSTTDGADGVFIQAQNSAVLNLTVQNSFFTAAHANLFVLDLQNTSSSDLVLSANSFVNGSSVIVPGVGGVAVGTSGTSNVSLTYAITGNTFRGASGTALSVAKGSGTGNFAGTISSNVIGASGVANSGSAQGSGIGLFLLGGGTHTAAVTGNQIRQYNGMGLLLQTGDNTLGGNGTLNATVAGNTVAEPGTALIAKNGIHLNAGTVTNDSHQVCLALSGNSITGSGSGGAAGTDFRLRQRMLTTVRLSGYAGANNDNAAVTAFVQANNPAAPTGLVQNNVAGGGGGFVNGASCPTP